MVARKPVHTQLLDIFEKPHSVCPKSLVHFYIITRYIKLDNTSWAFSIPNPALSGSAGSH